MRKSTAAVGLALCLLLAGCGSSGTDNVSVTNTSPNTPVVSVPTATTGTARVRINYDPARQVLNRLPASTASFSLQVFEPALNQLVQTQGPLARQGIVQDVVLGNLTPGPKTIRLLAFDGSGMRNGEIAAQLHLSVSTVKCHVRSLFGKLAVSDRTQLLAEAFRRGLVSPPLPVWSEPGPQIREGFPALLE